MPLLPAHSNTNGFHWKVGLPTVINALKSEKELFADINAIFTAAAAKPSFILLDSFAFFLRSSNNPDNKSPIMFPATANINKSNPNCLILLL